MAHRRKTYEVTAARSGGWWALAVPALPGVHSQVRRLEQAEAMIRDAIALALEVAPHSFDVTVTPELDRKLREAVAFAKTGRQRRDDAAAEATRRIEAAIAIGIEQGLSTRDIADLLEVSFQYVAKIAARSHAA